ncbi:glycoside hydrolase family 65 protein [Companilactobacillus sp. FL22-1]|uniref:glycoside hydrolase family 65 protein n=1 Tax=Companilactobacillus sp. FL22-1 TaxID=3373892 RepID=UPI0037548032
MKSMYLKVTDTKFYYADNIKNIDDNFFAFSDDMELNQILQKFKETFNDSFDVIIITNPNVFLLKNNIFVFQNNIVDFATAIEDVFHIPVINLDELEHDDIHQAVQEEIDNSTWHLDYYGVNHGKRQYGQESMQTIGNGFLGLRGTYLEAKANDDNYPATYVAGVFNQLSTPINGRDIINEDLVNLPNAQYISFGIDDGEPFTIDEDFILESNRSLDLRTGVLTIDMLVKLLDGKELKITEKKLASLAHYHDYYLQYIVEPLNFSGKVTIYTQTDGTVVNSNVERYRNLAKRHLVVDTIKNSAAQSLMLLHTNQSEVQVAIKTDIDYSTIKDPQYSVTNQDEIAEQQVAFTAIAGQKYSFEKKVTIYTSLETDINVELAAEKHEFLPSFAQAQAETTASWKKIWHNENIVIKGDITAQKLLRFNIYSMNCAAQIEANQYLDASIGSRGLTGEGYRGHIFWDELFDLDYYVLHQPDLVKSLLMYRYNRLGAAKDYASDSDYNGAMYPWQSAMYGDEQSQEVHLNPITNQWDPDNSRKQRHVSLAIAYNIWNYYHLTRDENFMADYGLEMLLEISKFWLDLAKLDPITEQYSISNVMGPDEFHEGYPGNDDDGLTNNAYTNIMVSWLFKKLLYLITSEPSDVLEDNFERTNFSTYEIQKLDDVRRSLKLDFKDDILGQFENYFDLKELDLDKYRQKYGNISRMDRILKANDDNPDNYQVAKQADTLMALFNLTDNEFFDILSDLGYSITNTDRFLADNINYYLARTTHGSTLSRIVYTMLLLKINNHPKAWKLFYEALTSDYYDIQGGTTAEGLHLGVMGATLNVVTTFFAGVDTRGEVLEINPNLPEQWHEIDFSLIFKGTKYRFHITKGDIVIKSDRDATVIFTGKKLPLVAGQEIQLTF